VANSSLDQVFRYHNEEIFLTAAKATRGLIITQNEQIAESSFHSTCGGHTASAKKIWGTAHKHLKGVNCNYCKKSPTYSWRYEIGLKDLEKIFGQKIVSIKLLERTKDGRVNKILLSGSKNSKISIHSFRRKVGTMKIKSTNIAKVNFTKNKVVFLGKGFGHGVGLCQYGAMGMADQGFIAQDILSYYYPKTNVKKIY
jgi:stage II sporulation protein D